MTDFGADAAPFTAPIATVSGRPAWRNMFASFRVFNFRLSFVGSLFNSVGGWMARIAIDWLVFELTSNVAAVGLTVALQFAPMLLLAPWAGLISDRYSRRRTLIITNSATTAAIALLAVLVLAGHVEVWHVYAIATFTGITAAIDAPSRSAFISEVVGTDRLRNAISLNAMTFHFGGLIGPAVSGILIAGRRLRLVDRRQRRHVGRGADHAVLHATQRELRPAAATGARGRTVPPGDRLRRREADDRLAADPPRVRRGLRHAAAGAAHSRRVAGRLRHRLGWIWPVQLDGGCRCVRGRVLLAQAGRSLRLRSLVTAVAVYGLVTAFIGIAPASVLFLAAIIGAGATRVTFMVSADAMVQLSARATIRGRVVSLWLMVFAAGQALGGPLMGWIAQTYGVTISFLVAGGVPAVAAITAACVLARRARLRLRVDLRSPRSLVTIERGRGVPPSPLGTSAGKGDPRSRRRDPLHSGRRRVVVMLPRRCRGSNKLGETTRQS